MSEQSEETEKSPVRTLANGNIKVYADGSLTYNQFVKRGIMLVNREALDDDDPDQVFNFLNKHGVDPRIYGIVDPKEEIVARYDKLSRRDLIFKVIELEKQLDQAMRHAT